MTTVELNETGDVAIFSISWESICEKYASRFREQSRGKRKIHFDSLPDEIRTVDGAKAKWLLLVMLDAMIFFLVNDLPIESARRYFHQQRELCDVILSEISYAYEQLQELVSCRKIVDISSICVEAIVRELSYPWNNLDSFRSFHHKSTPTKAKRKFLEIVKVLSNHTAMRSYNFDMLSISNQVLIKVLASRGYCRYGDNDGTYENQFVEMDVDATPSQLVQDNILRENISTNASSNNENSALDRISNLTRIPTSHTFNSCEVSSKSCQPSRKSSTLTTFDGNDIIDKNYSASVSTFHSPAELRVTNSNEVSLKSSDARTLLPVSHFKLHKHSFRKLHAPSPLLSAYKPNRAASLKIPGNRSRVETSCSFRKVALYSPVLQFQCSMAVNRMNATDVAPVNSIRNTVTSSDGSTTPEKGKLEGIQFQMDTNSKDGSANATGPNDCNKWTNPGPSYVSAKPIHSSDALSQHHFESSVSSAMDDIDLNIAEDIEFYYGIEDADAEQFLWDITAEDIPRDASISTKNNPAQIPCSYIDSKEFSSTYCREENGGSAQCFQQDRKETSAQNVVSTASRPQQRNFVLDREMYYRAMMDMSIHESDITNSTAPKKKRAERQKLSPGRAKSRQFQIASASSLSGRKQVSEAKYKRSSNNLASSMVLFCNANILPEK